LSALAVGLKYRFGYDDSLDVVGVHLVAGLWGTVALGFLATGSGLFYGGGISQLVVQILIALVAVIFSAVVTAIIALILKATMGWRIDEDAEVAGIDQAVHAESAYDYTGGTGRLTGVGAARAESSAPSLKDTDTSEEARA
ncbi:MAG: ammonium transporter, partial [Tetrasphaera sp.]|nr:ammonium transporter [Tetrasphaera sp.]